MKYLVYRRYFGTSIDKFYDCLIGEFCDKSDAELFIKTKENNDDYAIYFGYLSYVLVADDNCNLTKTL